MYTILCAATVPAEKGKKKKKKKVEEGFQILTQTRNASRKIYCTVLEYLYICTSIYPPTEPSCRFRILQYTSR